MDRAITEKAITIILTEIHLRLDEAMRIAKLLRPARWPAALPRA